MEQIGTDYKEKVGEKLKSVEYYRYSGGEVMVQINLFHLFHQISKPLHSARAPSLTISVHSVEQMEQIGASDLSHVDMYAASPNPVLISIS